MEKQLSNLNKIIMKTFFLIFIIILIFPFYCFAKQYDVDYYKERKIDGKECKMFYSYYNGKENLVEVVCN